MSKAETASKIEEGKNVSAYRALQTKKMNLIDSKISYAASLESRCIYALISHLHLQNLDELKYLPVNLKDDLMKKLFWGHAYLKNKLKYYELLKSLVHTCTTMINVTMIKVDDDVLKIISSCSKLELLCLTRYQENICFSAQGLTDFCTNFPNLLILQIKNCHLVTDDIIKTICKNCTKLKELDIEGCSIGDLSLIAIAEYSNELLCLDVSRTKITDEGTLSLTKGVCGSTLFELRLNHCYSLTQVTLNCIRTYCHSLKVLFFYECPNITDEESINELHSIKLKQVSWTVLW